MNEIVENKYDSTNDAIISRIKYLISQEGVTQNEFALRIEMNASNLSKHLTGKLPINDSLLNKIVVNLGVSKSWLKDGADVPYAKNCCTIPMIAVENGSISQTAKQGTPVYDIDVTAGQLSRGIMFADENVIGRINIPGIPDNCRVVKVSGDSMTPVINNGDYIAVRELYNPDLIFWGQIYVVILDDYRMVKYVRKNTDPGMVTLRSENHNYDDIEISREDIREMMIVHNIIHVDSRM